MQRVRMEERDRRMLEVGRALLAVPFVIAAVLVSMILFGICAHSYEEKKAVKQEAYYSACEDLYVSNVREILASEGFVKCGINFTKIVDTNAGRNYNCVIYDSSFAYKDSKDLKAIEDSLKELTLAFDDADYEGTITYSIALSAGVK